MDVIVLVVGVMAGLGLAAASLRAAVIERRRRRSMVDVAALVASASAGAGTNALLDSALERALSDDATAVLELDEVLLERTDLSSFRPELGTWTEVKVFRMPWGNDYAMAANRLDLVHFKLEVWEAELMRLMDGTRTVNELVVTEMSERGFDPEGVSGLVASLDQAGFFSPRLVDVERAVELAIEPPPAPTRSLGRFLRTLQVSWDGAQRLVRAMYDHGMRWFFDVRGLAPAVAVATIGLVAFIAAERSGRFTLTETSPPLESLLLLGLGFLLTFFHELGHALVLIHNQRRIKDAGFMLYFGSPSFFVDATDGLMLDRWQRVAQSFAGPFSEMVLAGVASIIVWTVPTWPGSQFLYKFAVLNYFVIFLNLVPLLELDGYWILSDVIQVPDLRPRALEFTQHELWHKLRVREGMTLQEVGLTLYGLLGAVFTVFVLASAAYFWRSRFGGLLKSLWNGGAVGRVLLALLILFIAGPAIRGLIDAIRATARRLASLARRINFRLQSSWRIEAAELIDALPAFEDLPEDLLSDLSGRVRLRTIHAGQAVFRQGDRASAFYVVREGTVRIETEHPETGDVRVLNTLRRGDSFGELGLIAAAPRSATARAVDEVELFEVEKSTFDRLLADEIDAPEFGHTLQSLAELRELSPFRHLLADDLSEVLRHGGWVSASPGTELIRQGEPGDAFYAIGAGKADIVRDGVLIDTIGIGGFFGELALLHDAPRSATVIARTPIRAFRLERLAFEKLLADSFRAGTLRTTIDRSWEH